jgi:hypothetical protein
MFLLKNIYIVHRLHEKLTKSKRFKGDIARKFETVQKTQSFVLWWRGLCFQGISVENRRWLALLSKE